LATFFLSAKKVNLLAIMEIIQIHGKTKKYCRYSLGFLHVEMPLRRSALWLTEWVWFDRTILTLIALNSIGLAVQDKRPPYGIQNEIFDVADAIFTVLFTFECISKVIAMGFCGPHSYLSDKWNWLDFVVVISALIGIVGRISGGQSQSLGFLRVFRALRPLRSLSVSPGMRKLVNTVLLSVPKLGSVAGMALFVLLIFGILG
jgi:hypothetical protein